MQTKIVQKNEKSENLNSKIDKMNNILKCLWEIAIKLPEKTQKEKDREKLKRKFNPDGRAFSQLIAKELFGIQPMSAPVGQIFQMKYVYEGLDKAKFKKLFGG